MLTSQAHSHELGFLYDTEKIEYVIILTHLRIV